MVVLEATQYILKISSLMCNTFFLFKDNVKHFKDIQLYDSRATSVI